MVARLYALSQRIAVYGELSFPSKVELKVRAASRSWSRRTMNGPISDVSSPAWIPPPRGAVPFGTTLELKCFAECAFGHRRADFF